VTPIQTLTPTATAAMTPLWRQGEQTIDLTDYLRPAVPGRGVDVDAVRRLLDHAMTAFADDPPPSDRWLAPRLHSALRLTRSEAGDRWVWAWLAAHEFDGYVKWRFPGRGDEEEDETRRGTPLKRFTGQDRDNAISRLWWGGELCRDGADYGPVERAFIAQDVPNTWFALDAFHHPACAQAALRIVPDLSSKDINRLSRALDHVLTTIQLDVVAPAAPPDTAAIREWVEAEFDADALLEDTLPTGPDEAPVDAAHVDAVEKLIRRVAGEIDLAVPA
jgi:hypothetical protein